MIKYYLLRKNAEFFDIGRYMMTSEKTKILTSKREREKGNTECILTEFEKKQYKVKQVVFARDG